LAIAYPGQASSENDSETGMDEDGFAEGLGGRTGLTGEERLYRFSRLISLPLGGLPLDGASMDGFDLEGSTLDNTASGGMLQ
jgi:hypothetical protein